ncbi:hypothetical protein [Mycolicibacterium sp.]|uniref:hypothetical protein n=1 Tax=Mycolicibacterium sp. TaxID=2320850 RepID=UPI0037CBAF1A
MAELTCKLSALVFAELYRLLGATTVHSDSLDDRLSQLGYDTEWLVEASEAYELKWRSDAIDIDPDTAEDLALPGEHSLLASWLLAGLRNAGHSYDFSADLRAAVQRRMGADAQPLARFRPPSLSPIIRGWTLGRVVSITDPLLPMVPAAYPSDPHITAAYHGLVEHVLHLELLDPPWPELACTATYVRTGGLAEALRPPPSPPPYLGLSHSIDLLMSEARRHVPTDVYERLRQNWIRWVERRNVLTHVAPGNGWDRTFSESAEEVRTWEQLELTILGISQFVFQEVSHELLDSVPPVACSP